MSEALATREFTKEEVKMFLSDLRERSLETNGGMLHILISLNQMLRSPNANELFTEDLKTQARELWAKLKTAGVQLSDPPLLFGYPEVKTAAEVAAEEADGTDTIVIDMTRFREEERKEEEKRRKLKAGSKKGPKAEELEDDDDETPAEFEEDDSTPEPEEEA